MEGGRRAKKERGLALASQEKCKRKTDLQLTHGGWSCRKRTAGARAKASRSRERRTETEGKGKALERTMIGADVEAGWVCAAAEIGRR